LNVKPSLRDGRSITWRRKEAGSGDVSGASGGGEGATAAVLAVAALTIPPESRIVPIQIS
jgi:hypothetical protein